MGNPRLIRENEAQQARLREKLARMGGDLKPLRNSRRNPRVETDDPWDICHLARGVRIDIKSAKTDTADFAARGVVQALESCGFRARVVRESESTWEGVHVESRSDEAAAALLIQGAFRIAGFGAGLTIHDRAAAKRITVHVGPNGFG